MNAWIVGGALSLAIAGAAAAQGAHHVGGYVRQDGTYVAPHYQTNPDSTRANNWSTLGNVNPYTGAPGTRPAYPSGYAAPYQPSMGGGIRPLAPMGQPGRRAPLF